MKEYLCNSFSGASQSAIMNYAVIFIHVVGLFLRLMPSGLLEKLSISEKEWY
jgi:hypothetical protein